MSNHLQHYRDWEFVAVPAELRTIVDVSDRAMASPPQDDDVIDLRDDTTEAVSPVAEMESSPPDDDRHRVARAVQSSRAAREAAKRDAGLIPLGLHVDLRG